MFWQCVKAANKTKSNSTIVSNRHATSLCPVPCALPFQVLFPLCDHVSFFVYSHFVHILFSVNLVLRLSFPHHASPLSLLFFALSDVSQDSSDEESEEEEDFTRVQFGSRYTPARCVRLLCHEPAACSVGPKEPSTNCALLTGEQGNLCAGA